MSAERKNQNQSDSLLLVILMIVALPAVFLFGIMFGSGTKFSELRNLELLGLWVGALSTVAIAVLTIILAKETWQLRLLQIRQVDEIRKQAIEPSVEFHILPSPVSFQFMNIQVENNGRGIARDVTFSFSSETKSSAKSAEEDLLEKISSLNFISDGVTSIGPGKSRTSYLFSFLDLHEKYGEGALEVRFTVKMNFKDIEGHPYTSVTTVDFSELKGVSEIGGGDPIYSMSDELKKIRIALESYQGPHPSKRLNINVYGSDDRLEAKRQRDELREQNNGSKNRKTKMKKHE